MPFFSLQGTLVSCLKLALLLPNLFRTDLAFFSMLIVTPGISNGPKLLCVYAHVVLVSEARSGKEYKCRPLADTICWQLSGHDHLCLRVSRSLVAM